MSIITSSENQIYKLCVKLSSRKYRDQLGQYLVEGDKFVRDAFATGQRVDTVIAIAGYERECDFPGCRVVFMEGKLFSRLAQTKTSQGILAIAWKKQNSREQFRQQIRMKAGNVAVLDRLQDPGNIGTIIRTADAAGYGGIITIAGTADVYSPKIVRAAAGSLFRMPILELDTPGDAAEFLKAEGKTIVSTCPDAEADYYQIDLRRNIALVIGNEGSGISPEMMDLSDLRIKIPMEGSIDSLNASVAAGILMYESVRK